MEVSSQAKETSAAAYDVTAARLTARVRLAPVNVRPSAVRKVLVLN